MPTKQTSFQDDHDADDSLSLLEEMTNSMAWSMLIFLIADMRLMSATGRISTQFETIAVDSDFVTRTNAANLAGLVVGQEKDKSNNNNPLSPTYVAPNQGLSPAQLMAVVLIEMKRSVDAQKNNSTDVDDDETQVIGNFEHDEFGSFTTTPPSKKRGQKNRVRDDTMHALLKAYADMIDADRSDKVELVPARQSFLDLLRGESDERKKKDPAAEGESKEEGETKEEDAMMLSRVSEEEEEEQQPVINKLSDKESESQNSATSNPDEDNGDEGDTSFNRRFRAISESVRRHRAAQAAQTNQFLQRANETAKAILLTEEEKAQLQMESVTGALFQMGEKNESVRMSLGSSGEPSRALSEDELLKVMVRAVESREYGKLDFMSNFFRSGTISQFMVKSKARLVWVNDWYPIKDLTYAIAVDAERKRVLVVFRGAITKQDWSKVIDFGLRDVPNPIQEDFEGKPEKVGVYNGFYQYLFRTRKDTGTKKYDEIANIAHKYGMERIGEDYTLTVIGHSLGGALSTIFSFFASTDPRFTCSGPVKVFTFGSPYVGGHSFSDSFMHQEESGKLKYARFYNHNDFVAYVPANFAVTRRGCKFRHVGIGIKIPPVPLLLSNLRKWSPDVCYVGKEGFWASYCRGIGRNFLLHAPFPWQIPQMHTLAELQKRMILGRARKDRNVGRDYELLLKPIEELYQDLVMP